MLPPFFKSLRYPREFALLLALIFFIPLFEVPKNLLLVAFVVVWLGNRYRDGWRARRGGDWDVWDTLFALWIVSAYLVAAFSGLHKNEWHGVNDLWRYVSLVWLLKRSGYETRQWRMIYVAIGVSTLVATLWGIAALSVPHKYAGIELHSVGHVNHSATYVAISIGAVLSALVAYWQRLQLRLRAAGIATLLVFGVAIVLAGSRAASLVSLVIILVIGALWSSRSRVVLLAMLMALALFTLSIQTFDKDMHRKNELARASANPMLNERYPLWHQAYVAWRAHPWFGVGLDNFDEIDAASVKRWVEERGDPYDAQMYAGSSHAHSLYLTTLAERGVVGLGIVLAVLAAWGISLLRSWPRRTDLPLHWMVWGGAASALIATVAIGVVNTTLHHEHGLLSMLLLGCWLGSRHERATLRQASAQVTIVPVPS
ncbi:MAG: O-antigen ligase family protein [Betaproteobacteria bacterium]